MSVEEKSNSAEQIGTLGSCLIEGDSEQKSRERKIKRRALTISIALQSAVLVALVLTPLLGRTEKLTFNAITPIPPYPHHPRPVGERIQHHQAPSRCPFCAPPSIPQVIVMRDPSTTSDTPTGEPMIDGMQNLPDVGSGLNIADPRRNPAPPEDPNRNQKKRLVRGGDVQQAMLIRRVEPGYPPLMRNLRRSGKVEIKAVISMDGAVESLQVMSGDPGFYQSALQAVGQWRYRPTILNGQPVEVETIITVVYTLSLN